MEPNQAWSVIRVAISLPRPRVLTTFQKIIRKRLVKKKWGSFRVFEYEDILMNDKEYMLLYARHIIKGRLPEKMHRKMLAYGIANPNDTNIKFYFDVCQGEAFY